ncbi:MAG: histidine-type phosphatase [Paramuribaculum sp.]|nr:histidine-type phosphatase [Paramuribaculum sp.]
MSAVILYAQTDFTYNECLGSSRPYVDPKGKIQVPDTLRPVMVNHVGRHGARYMSSGKKADEVRKILKSALEKRTITPKGRRLLALTERIIDRSTGRWGALDTLGKAEQRWLAARLYGECPRLLNNTDVNAISTYVPRCVASMYEFTHQLVRQNNKIDVFTASGRQNNHLLRFFDNNEPLEQFMNSDRVKDAVENYAENTLPKGLLAKFTGTSFPFQDFNETDILLSMYSVVAGTAAIEMKINYAEYFTREEFNALWRVANLKQYLTHSASALSDLPAQSAKPLLLNLISTTDSFISGADKTPIRLRFAHAETLMPLLALIHLQDCYYVANDLNTVAENWQNFNVVPMAANFRLILFRSNSGKYYIRADHNEKPVPLIPGGELYSPWADAKAYMLLRAGEF